MRNHVFIRFLLFFTALFLTVCLLAACGEEAERPESDQEEISQEIDTSVQSMLDADSEKVDFGEIDFDGYEFTFICQPYKDGTTSYPVNYMVADSKGQSQLLDAVFERNALLEKKYNVSFHQTLTQDLVTTVRSQVLSGTTEFDVIVGSCQRLANFAKEGLLLDLNSVEKFDLSKSYWDQNANEQLRIGSKLYFTNCDFNVQELAFLVYFNKQVVREYNLETPYEHIKNNTWTLDSWAEMTKAVSKDLNGDGRANEGDQFGTLYEHHNPRMFLYGCDIRVTTNDDTGLPKVTLFKDPDRTTKAYDKLKEVFSDPTVSFDITGNLSDPHGWGDIWDYARSLFMQDLFLFHYCGIDCLPQFADMEGDFGMVPFPKYDEKQKGYFTMYPLNCAVVGLPSTLAGDELERTSIIFEDLNFHSKELVKKYWYETILKRRSSRDDESAEYLDVIKDGRVYDLAMYYDFGGIRSKVLDVDCAGQNINTNFKRNQKAIEADIKHVFNEYQKIG